MENLDDHRETREGRIKNRISGKKTKKDNEEEKVEKKEKRLRTRLIPIWLRLIIVLFLILLLFFIGAMIGYGVIGDGKPTDVFKKSTWTHILEIVNDGTGSK
ncbi:DNA-directed RNA polymerase subunit beta [Caldifermentibacillus hisashii]|uniref:DNA-directed RNA polymerase subunit beta n=1 Tax=Caldifermentibacillus hisashii TaxID=996558 RepID=UPI0030E813A8